MEHISSEELDTVIRLHQLYLDGDSTGVRADLEEADLREAYLGRADLRGADLEEQTLIILVGRCGVVHLM